MLELALACLTFYLYVAALLLVNSEDYSFCDCGANAALGSVVEVISFLVTNRRCLGGDILRSP